MLDVERLKSLSGKIYSYSVIPNDLALKWSEGFDAEVLGLISTSGLLKILHACGHTLLSEFETDGLVSVVSRTGIEHFAPVLMDIELTIHLKVEEVNGFDIVLSGMVFQRDLKRASFEFTRRFVSLDFLRRSVSA